MEKEKTTDIIAEEIKIYNKCPNKCEILKSLKYVVSTPERSTGVKDKWN
jgi:hypothetical protein